MENSQLDSPIYRQLFIGSISFFYVVEQYLRFRKGRAMSEGLPDKLKGVISEEDYASSRDYNIAKNKFGYVSDTVTVALGLGLFFYAPTLWAIAVEYAGKDSQYVSLVLFQTLLGSVSFVCTLPTAVYYQFVVEEKFGFNNQTGIDFAKDKIKAFLVQELLISQIMMVGLVWIMNLVDGPDLWFYLWVFLSGLVFVLQLAYPVLILPLFNTFKDIGNEGIKEGINSLITQTGLDCKKVFEVDGSKQSSHSNAYVAGLCCAKRIVVYDTLIKHLDAEVPLINAVVGHEIGHSVLHHNWVLLGCTNVLFFVMFYSFGFVQTSDIVASSFGYSNITSFLRLYCFMEIFMRVIFPLYQLFSNFVVRTLEYQADRYAASLGLDISAALVKISKENKGDFNPDWLHSLYHHNHPHLLERMEAVAKYTNSKKKK